MDIERLLSVRPALSALCIGVLTGVIATTPHVWLLMFVCIAPLFVTDFGTIGRRDAWWRGLAFGFGYGGVVFSWTFSWLGLLLTTSLPIPLALGMSAYSWVLTVGTPALGYAAWFVIHRELSRRLEDRHLVALVSASSLVICEVSGAFLFHLVFWGQASSLVPHFAFGMLGYALGESARVLQYAWLGGVFLLSWVVVYANLLVAGWRQEGSRSFLVVWLLLILFPCALYEIRVRAPEAPTLSVGLIHTEFDSNFDWTPEGLRLRHEQLAKLFQRLVAQRPSLVVLPEGSDFEEQESSLPATSTIRHLLAAATSTGIIVADSVSITTPAGSRSRVYYWGAPRDPFAEKRVLLPQGEYVPYIQRMLQSIVSSPESFAALQNTLSYIPGPLDSNTQIGSAVIGTRFCSESISPFLYMHNAAYGAQLFVNVASHSWFVESDLLSRRTEQFGRVRAAEASRWYVQAGNKTSSFVVDHLGRIVARVSDEQVVAVEMHDERSPYAHLASLYMRFVGL